MKKKLKSLFIMLILIIGLSVSSASSTSQTNSHYAMSTADDVYLGYASIVGNGNSSFLEASPENNLLIKIASSTERLDFYITFNMTCNGIADEGIITVAISLNGENISANATQTPTSKKGSLYLHDIEATRGDKFVFIITVIYGNLVPIYHNETAATGAALIVKTKMAGLVDNTPPYPPKVDGPIFGKTGELYIYEVTVSDPDEEEGLIKLEMDFGNELITEESGCCGETWDNGQTITISHKWDDAGSYAITARVMDIQGEWGNWSEPLHVSMPKQHSASSLNTNHHRVPWDCQNIDSMYWISTVKAQFHAFRSIVYRN